jgi:hypothetical protein
MAGDEPRVGVSGVVGRALEHEVLEEVRQAGVTGCLVGRPDAVPKHMCEHRRSVVGDQNHLHPVGELERVGVEHPG